LQVNRTLISLSRARARARTHTHIHTKDLIKFEIRSDPLWI